MEVDVQEKFAASGATEEPMEATGNSMFRGEYEPSMLTECLHTYYQDIFPFQEYFDWLNYDQDSFSHREFSFTLKNDVYLRYQSFDNKEELIKRIRPNSKGSDDSLPCKIDIGAIYSHKPRDRKRVMGGNFKAEKKELVFDIDMTDYDDVRTCCSEAKICPKCWKFIVIAIRIVDRALREDFGYNNLLWVYSGRRGVHCWVCDPVARELPTEARAAIVEYLTFIKGGEQQAKKVSLKGGTHPSVTAAIEIIEEYFYDDLLIEQGFLDNEEQWTKVLALIPNKSVAEGLSSDWRESGYSSTPGKKWQQLRHSLKDKPNIVNEILIQLAYPRLDVNVSKGINHLLKSPLCIHPKTGRVCVPIDTARVDDFDPFIVPTVSQLCQEIDTTARPKGDERPGYKYTSLRPYMKTFNNFVLKLRQQTSQYNIKKEQSLEF